MLRWWNAIKSASYLPIFRLPSPINPSDNKIMYLNNYGTTNLAQADKQHNIIHAGLYSQQLLKLLYTDSLLTYIYIYICTPTHLSPHTHTQTHAHTHLIANCLKRERVIWPNHMSSYISVTADCLSLDTAAGMCLKVIASYCLLSFSWPSLSRFTSSSWSGPYL